MFTRRYQNNKLIYRNIETAHLKHGIRQELNNKQTKIIERNGPEHNVDKTWVEVRNTIVSISENSPISDKIKENLND